MENTAAGAVEGNGFDDAIKQWVKENFTGNWQPSVEMVKTQLIELYGIDSVNRFQDVSKNAGLALLESQYYDALNKALSDVENVKVGSLTEV